MRRLLMAGVALGIGVTPAQGQTADDDGPRHQGFWIGFGIGGGLNLDAPNAREGGAAYLRMGGTINQQLLIGGEASGWGRDVQGGTVSRANATATIYFYPSLEGGPFLKSGLGFASAQVQATSGNTTVTISDGGFGATFGVGYDFRVGRNFYITPNLDYLVQIINEETDSIVLLTVGAGWH